MKPGAVVRASLRHHRAAHRTLALGVAVASASLVGALVLGASVKESLRTAAHARTGAVTHALVGGERTFTAALADRLAAQLPADPEGGPAAVAPLWLLTGLATRPDGRRSADGVQVLGVDERFLALAPEPGLDAAPPPGEAWLGAGLAARLEVAAGDDLVCRLPSPSGIPRDMLMSTREDAALALRVRVGRVVGDEGFARFALASSQVPPDTLLVAREWLAGELAAAGRANALLVGAVPGDADLDAALRAAWSLADAELSLREVRDGAEVELVSRRVFLDAPVVDALARLEPPATGIVTYFVNALEHGERSTPYSMVSGLGPLRGAGPPAGREALVPPERAGAPGLVASAWLADDLALAPGDEVTLRYFVLGDERRLVERETRFAVTGVVPLEGVAADPSLAPDLPGLSGADDCRDWEPGVPVELDRIRDVDEAYWDEHRGTPKAFLRLDEARALWGSRFGDTTAVRVPADRRAELEIALREALDPASVGLFLVDVGARANAASKSPTDFGGLFLGLSFFLITGALILTGLLYVLAVERRSQELGVLLALGLPRRLVRRLFLTEAAGVALLGSAGGALLGLLYTRALLSGLASVWKGAVASAAVAFHAPAGTVVGGALAAWLVSLAAMVLAVRRAFRAEPLALLAVGPGEALAGRPARPRRDLLWAGAFALLAALGSAFADPGSPEGAGVFFGLGASLLVALVFLVRAGLGAGVRRLGGFTLAGLGRRNAARRRGRSVATVSLFAGGVFLVVSIAVHQKGPPRDTSARDSGTGGFALVATTSLPVLHDLDDAEGRDAYALSAEELAGVSFVALRVRDGDEASCLSLNRPQAPRLLGVRPAALAERGAFAFTETWEERPRSWALLEEELPDGAVPAVVDESSLLWILKGAVGDVLTYRDERGRELPVRIVATLADSILQGNLVISEGAFTRAFPSESGHRFLLVDAPPARVDAVRALLGRALADVGPAIEPAGERLGRFQAVQNTYLAMFQTLGGLGLLLGTAGLGVLLLRNTLERRAELATVRALGFGRGDLTRYVASEFLLLFVVAVLGGSLCALAAVAPVVRGDGLALFLDGVLWTLALFAFGLLALSLATRRAVAGELLVALRSE